MKILVVVDMQKDFTTGALGNAECAATIPKVIDILKNGEYDKVFVTRDTHQENYMDTNEGKHLPVVHCIEGTDGWQVVDEIEAVLKGLKDVTYFDKPTFGSTRLADAIEKLYKKDKDIQIDFVGVCTGICVISNVLLTKAHCPESTINVIADACACVTPDTHKTALAAMKLCHIEII